MASTIEVIFKVFYLTLFRKNSQNSDGIIFYFVEVLNKLKILVALIKTYVNGKRSALINFVFLKYQ